MVCSCPYGRVIKKIKDGYTCNLSYVQLHYMPGNLQSVPLANATTTYLWNSNISDACASVCATDPKKMSSQVLLCSIQRKTWVPHMNYKQRNDIYIIYIKDSQLKSAHLCPGKVNTTMHSRLLLPPFWLL